MPNAFAAFLTSYPHLPKKIFYESPLNERTLNIASMNAL